MRKLQDKVSKCQDNVKKSKDQYELAVSDINNYNSRYQEVKLWPDCGLAVTWDRYFPGYDGCIWALSAEGGTAAADI